MKTISMAVNNRPQLLRSVLESIRGAEGHENWTLVFSLEPGCLECQQMVGEVDWMETRVSYNTFRLGCDVNTFMAADLAASFGSEFNLHLEDDILIAKDALLMAEAFMARPESRDRSIVALRRIYEDFSDPCTLKPSHDGLLGCGFGYRTKFWHRWLRGWWLYYESLMPGYGWDLQMAWMLHSHDFIQFRPLMNRSMNIGGAGGTHATGHDPYQASPMYSGLVREFNFE